MKKLLIILLGTFAFACGNSGNDMDGANNAETTIEEDVEIGAGEEISPQLELEGDSAENFGVDTVSSATDINQEER